MDATESYKDHEQALSELSSEYETLSSDIETVKDEMDGISGKIAEINGHKIKTSVDENELARLNDMNAALQTRLDLLELEAAYNRADAEKEAKAAVDSLTESINQQTDRYRNLEEMMARYDLRLADGTLSQVEYKENTALISGEMADAADKLLEYGSALAKQSENFSDATVTGKQYLDNITTLTGGVNELLKGFGMTIEAVPAVDEEVRTVADSITALNDEINALIETNRQNIQENDAFIDSTKKTDQALYDLSAAHKKVQDGGRLTKSEIESLSEAFPELTAFIAENGMESANNAELLESLGIQTRTELQKTVDAQIAAQISNIESMKSEAMQSAISYGEIIDNITKAAEARSIFANVDKRSRSLGDDKYGFKDTLFGSAEAAKFQENVALAEQELDKLLVLKESLSGGAAADSYSGGGGGGSGKSAADEAERLQKEQLDADMAAYEHRVRMGELSTAQQIEELEKIRSAHELSLEEERKFAVDMKALREQLTEDEISAFDRTAKMSKLSTAEQIAGYKEILETAELTTDQRLDLEEKLFDLEGKLTEERKDNTEKLSKIMTDQYKAQIEAAKAERDTKISYLKDAAFEEKSLIDDVSYMNDKARDDEIRKLEGVTDAKIKLIDEVYIAEVAASDATSAEILKNINAETQAIIDQLAITNRPLYDEIMKNRDAKQSIKDELDARAAALEEQRHNERVAELERQAGEAETAEKAQEIWNEIDKIRVDREYELWQDSQDAEIKRLEDREKELIGQINKNNATAQKEADQNTKNDLETSIKQLETDFAVLETKYNDLIETAMTDAEAVMKTEAKEMGKLTVDGIIAGMSEKETEAKEAAKALAQSIVDAFNEAMNAGGSDTGDAFGADAAPQSATAPVARTAPAPASQVKAFASVMADNAPAVGDIPLSPIMARARAFSNTLSSGLYSTLSDNARLINTVAQKVGLSGSSGKTQAPPQIIENSPTIHIENNISGAKAEDIPYLTDRANRRAERRISEILKQQR